ncbi:hypothetical protein GGI12_001827 [Dipsacomyces acuminosporus]|nr:hypothetical protein GGI12_001827 [Dipsacomyces acuminosporus]
MVKRIPKEYLLELLDNGTMEYVRRAYWRDTGRLAITNHMPFRTLYFYSIVAYHLRRYRALGSHEILKICDGAVLLHNAALSATPDTGVEDGIPTLLGILCRGYEQPDEPLHDPLARESLERHMHNNALLSNAKRVGEEAVSVFETGYSHLLARYVEQRCVIRPIYTFIFQRYLDGDNTHSSLVFSSSLQFEIYRCAHDVIARVFHGQKTPAMFNTLVVMFAIIKTNETIFEGILADQRPDSAEIRLRTTINNNGVAGNKENACADTGSLSDKDMIGFLDWNLATALGYVLAVRYDEENCAGTLMRARLGALCYSVDITKPQPFPPVLVAQDSGFHSFIWDYLSAVYGPDTWPDGFAYMVIECAVKEYNEIVYRLRGGLRNQ